MLIQDYPYKTKPFKHQRDTLEKTADEPFWAYFLEQGLGKSKILIDNGCYLWLCGKINGMVIFTVKGMAPSFELVEIPVHTPDEVDYSVFRYDASRVTLVSYKKQFDYFLKQKYFKIFIVNVESAATSNLKNAMNQFYKAVSGKYMCGVDESSRIKTHTAKRSKAVVMFSRKAKYRRIMTGTPITNGPLELFGQASALGNPEDLLGHKSFYSFRGYYANMEKKTFGNRSFNVVTSYKNTEEFTEMMSAWSTIIKKEDALDLPEKMPPKIVPVEMTKEQRQMYETLRQEAIIELEELGETVEVTNILTMMVKLHQIVCGQLKHTDEDTGKETYVSIPNNRLPTLMDILEEEQGKIIIWANYRQSIKDVVKAIEKEYPKSVVEFHGGVSNADKATAVARFQKDDSKRFFVANPQSAGMGLTLTAADLAIYYSNDYSLESRLQSEDRIHRIGQTKIARYMDLATLGTVDEKIIKALIKKRKFTDSIVKSNWRDIL